MTRWMFMIGCIAIPAYFTYIFFSYNDAGIRVATISIAVITASYHVFMFPFIRRLSTVAIDGEKLIVRSPRGTITPTREEIKGIRVLEALGYKFIELEFSDQILSLRPTFLESIVIKNSAGYPKSYDTLTNWKNRVEQASVGNGDKRRT